MGKLIRTGLLLLAVSACSGATFEARENTSSDEPAEVLAMGATVLDLPAADLAMPDDACGLVVTHRLAVPAGACAVLSITGGSGHSLRAEQAACSDAGQCAVFSGGELLTVAELDATVGTARVWVEALGADGACERRCAP